MEQMHTPARRTPGEGVMDKVTRRAVLRRMGVGALGTTVLALASASSVLAARSVDVRERPEGGSSGRGGTGASNFLSANARVGDIVFASRWVNYMSWGTWQHTGIVADPVGQTVIHADGSLFSRKPGVEAIAWSRFVGLGGSVDAFNEFALVRVRDVTPDQAARVVDWVRAHIGTPYRMPFIDGTDKNNDHRMYCSQLVWVAYKRVLNIDLDGDGGWLVTPDDIYYNRAKVAKIASVRP